MLDLLLLLLRLQSWWFMESSHSSSCPPFNTASFSQSFSSFSFSENHFVLQSKFNKCLARSYLVFPQLHRAKKKRNKNRPKPWLSCFIEWLGCYLPVLPPSPTAGIWDRGWTSTCTSRSRSPPAAGCSTSRSDARPPPPGRCRTWKPRGRASALEEERDRKRKKERWRCERRKRSDVRN